MCGRGLIWHFDTGSLFLKELTRQVKKGNQTGIAKSACDSMKLDHFY